MDGNWGGLVWTWLIGYAFIWFVAGIVVGGWLS